MARTLSTTPAALAARARRAAKAVDSPIDHLANKMADEAIAAAKASATTPAHDVGANAPPLPKVGRGLSAAKKTLTAPSKPVVTDAAGAPAPVTQPRPHGKFTPLVVAKVTDFNGATQAQLEVWYEAATGKDSTKAQDLLGACIAAFKKGKNADAAAQKTSGTAIGQVAAALKAAPAVKTPRKAAVKTAGPTGRPRGLLSAPPADMPLTVAADTSRIRAGFTLEMLQAAQALVKKNGSFTRAQLYAKFSGQPNAKLTDAFYCGTERGIYVPA